MKKKIKFGDYIVPDGSISRRSVPLAEPKLAPKAPAKQAAPATLQQGAQQ